MRLKLKHARPAATFTDGREKALALVGEEVVALRLLLLLRFEVLRENTIVVMLVEKSLVLIYCNGNGGYCNDLSNIQ